MAMNFIVGNSGVRGVLRWKEPSYIAGRTMGTMCTRQKVELYPTFCQYRYDGHWQAREATRGREQRVGGRPTLHEAGLDGWSQGGAREDRYTHGRWADGRRDLVVIYHMIVTPGNFRAPSAKLCTRALGCSAMPSQGRRLMHDAMWAFDPTL